MIVGFWKRKPVLAFIVAAIVMILTIVVPVTLEVLSPLVTEGKGDPQLMAGRISEGIMAVGLVMIVCLPILFVFQWLILRRHKRKLPKLDVDKTFS